MLDRRIEVSHPVITLEQARADGWTSSQLRTIARSLERIASHGYQFTHETGDYKTELSGECDPRVNRRNAHLLRKLARELG